MHKRYFRFITTIAVLTFALIPISMSAQSWQESLKEGKQLYLNKMYQNAQSLFLKAARQIESQEGNASRNLEEAEGYALLCELKLGTEASPVKAFSYIRKYPTSLLNTNIRFEAASSYFAKEEYVRALSLMEELKPADIPLNDRDRYLLEKGVCLMKENRMVEAQNHLMEIGNKSKLYGSGQYYLGYIEYMEKNFTQAIEYFRNSDNPMVPLHMADCHFMLKDYLYVYKNAHQADNYEGTEKAHFARIISESAYALGQTADAERYFKIYSEEKELSKTDNFYSGMLAYGQGKWREAANMFLDCQTFSDADSLSQNALYRLGRCQIELKDKVSAADAFQKASQMDYNPQVKEDAFFNYAKLYFDLWSNTDRLYEYMEKYNPGTAKKDETYGYIATKCLEDNNFQDAIHALHKISSPTEADKANLQKANFFQGIRLMEEGRFLPAQTYLNEAAGNRQNSQISNLASYWLAESLFRQDKFQESLDILESLKQDASFQKTAEYQTSFFNSGYSNLRLKNIDKAYRDFSRYVELASEHGEYSLEAKLRMADCKFMERDFSAATALYSSIAAKTARGSLYAPLQEALAQGLMGNSKKKADILKKYTSDIYRSAEKFSEALYELGRTQIQLADSKAAEKTLLRLVENPADSLYYTKALMELGMLYSNLSNTSKAKEYYRKAAAYSTDSEDIQAAMSAYQNICNLEGSPDEYHRWVSQLASSNKVLPGSDEEKRQMLFNSAEQIYLAEKYDAAAEAFENFIAEHPEYNKAKSWYYLADSRSHISDFSGAAEAYEKLCEISDNPDNRKQYAMAEMDMHFKAKDYNKIILKSSVYKERMDFSSQDGRLLSYYQAKALIAEGLADKATDLLLDVAENIQDEIGAESAYLLVKDAFDRGKFEKVESMVFSMAEEKTPQMYYLAKCYLLLGDSYYELGDYEQAKAVYESIFKSYEGDSQIKETALAKSKLAGMRKQQ